MFHMGNGEDCSYASQMKKFVHVFLVENENVFGCVRGKWRSLLMCSDRNSREKREKLYFADLTANRKN